jgi:hypothetical protein
VREERGASGLAGRVGRKRVWAAAEKKKGGGGKWVAGLGWVVLFFLFFFSNPFQIFSNLSFISFQIKF